MAKGGKHTLEQQRRNAIQMEKAPCGRRNATARKWSQELLPSLGVKWNLVLRNASTSSTPIDWPISSLHLPFCMCFCGCFPAEA